MTEGPPREFLEPWWRPDAAGLAAMDAELARELEFNPRHPLHGVKARAVARRTDCDDVLFELEGHFRLAIVHFTWSRSPETAPQWPETTLFASWSEWVSLMNKDHQEWAKVGG
jgi:hypothetical protein